MSSIDNPGIIRKLIEPKGSDPGGMSYGRRMTAQIWKYVTGFGGICYKLIYGLYSNGDSTAQGRDHFHHTGNIKSGTIPVCIFNDGKLTPAGEAWWAETFGQQRNKCSGCGAESHKGPPDCAGWCPGGEVVIT